MKKLLAVFTIFSLFIFSSCLKEKTSPLSGCESVVSYSVEVRPIIESSCKTGGGAGCHDSWIDEYDNIVGYMANGSWKSEVVDNRRMPLMPNDFSIDSLSGDEIKTMQCWIDQGYPEN